MLNRLTPEWSRGLVQDEAIQIFWSIPTMDNTYTDFQYTQREFTNINLS